MKIRTIDDASTRIVATDTTPAYRTKLLRFVRNLSIPRPIAASRWTSSAVTLARLHNALNFLKVLGIASNDTVITVIIHLAIEYLSSKRLVESSGLEGDRLD